MNLSPVPIQHFVTEKYLSKPIQKLVESWRLEPRIVIDKLVAHFREMGIFTVTAQHEKLMLQSIVHYLKSSPELSSLAQRARSEELRRQRSRHAE